MHQYLYRVDFSLFQQAKNVWKKHYRGSMVWDTTEERDFCDFIGITDRTRIEYNDSWILAVPAITYKKLEVMASDTPHHKTLFKVIEARYGNNT